MVGNVQPLSVEVIKRLRTGINLLSVAHCVEELVLNSIDAGATCIAIHLNLPVYQIQVIDNGDGISAEPMEIIGTRYATSKCHSLDDLKNLKSGGFRGEALASLAEVSSILMIESRSSKSTDTYCKIFTQGKVLAPKKSVNARPSKGTTVSVYDFMYNMPVRRNSFSAALDLEECRKVVQAIALMHQNVSFTLKNEHTGENVLQLRKCTSLSSSFSQIFGKRKSDCLKEVSFKRDGCEVSGCIGTQCMPSKDFQFLYVNKRLVLHTRLHKLVNSILSKALCSKKRLKKSTPDGCSPNKNQAQHCMFILNISCGYDMYDIILEPRKTMIEFSDWDGIIKLVEDCLTSFLIREKLFLSPEADKLDILPDAAQGVVDPFACDYRAGLFSHSVRRLHNDPNTTSTVDESCTKPSDNISSSLEPAKTINDSPSLVCLSSSHLSRSILEGLNDMSSQPSVSNKIPDLIGIDNSKGHTSTQIAFPTKDPIVLSMPVKSTLSEIQSVSSSCDLLSKLKEKFRFSPVRRSTLHLDNKTSNLRSFQEKISRTRPLHLRTLTSHENISSGLRSSAVPRTTKDLTKSTKDKSFQCPSISTNLLKPCHGKVEVKEKASQCPSVSLGDQKRIVSRFDFPKESSAVSLKCFKRTRRRVGQSSENLIQECISTVEDLLKDAPSNRDSDCGSRNQSSFSSRAVYKQMKDLCFETEESIYSSVSSLSSCNAHLSNQPAYFPCPGPQQNKGQSIGKKSGDKSLRTCIDHSAPLFSLKSFRDYKADNKSGEDSRPAPYTEAGDFASSFSMEQTLLSESKDFVSSTQENEKERQTFMTVSASPCSSQTFELEKESGSYESGISESTLHTSTVEKPKKNANQKRSYPFEISERASLNVKSNLNLSVDFIGGSRNLKEPKLKCGRSPKVGSLPVQNNFHPLNIDSYVSRSSPNVVDEIYDIIHELVNDVVLNPIESGHSMSCSARECSLQIPKSLISEVDSVSDSEEIQNDEPMKPNNYVHKHESKIAEEKNVPNYSHELFDDSCSELSETVESSACLKLLSCNPKAIPSYNYVKISKAELGDFKTSINPHFTEISSKYCGRKYLDTNNFNIGPHNLSMDIPDKESPVMPSILAQKACVRYKAEVETVFKANTDPFFKKTFLKSPESKGLDENCLNAGSYSLSMDIPFTELSGMPNILVEDAQKTSGQSEAGIETAFKPNMDPLIRDTFSKSPEMKDFSENNLNTGSYNLSIDIPFTELSAMPIIAVDDSQSAAFEVSVTDVPNCRTSEEVISNRSALVGSYSLSKTNNMPAEKNENILKLCENWEPHLEPTTKRTVYIDSKTGNSTFVPKVAPEDLAASFADAAGRPQKSHFFLSHNFSPFVAKTQSPSSKGVCSQFKSNFKKFVQSSRRREQTSKWRMSEGQSKDDSDCEFQNLLNKWDNPMFEVPFEVAGVGDRKALQSLPQMHTFLNSYKFSKDSLKSLEVIGQVDCKFIACNMKNFNKDPQEEILVLFDQHAVHERVRLEEILENLNVASIDDQKLIKSEPVSPALKISMDCEEIRLLQTYQKDLPRIGIQLEIDDCQSCSVYSVPACLVHKKTKDLRRSQADTIIILQNSISEWLSSIVKTRSLPQILPKTLMSVVNYQACRGAVKFGDPLTFDQCCILLDALSKCKLPFQCAHGRPSIAPILDLKKLKPLFKKGSSPQLWKLSGLFKG